MKQLWFEEIDDEKNSTPNKSLLLGMHALNQIIS